MEKTIVEKLNLAKYEKKVILNEPKERYFSELQNVQREIPNSPVDLIITFVTTMEEFKIIVDKVIENQLLTNNGLLCVAYPKKGNKKYQTFVHRDEIFPSLKISKEDKYIEGTSFKFNKMVLLDDIFTIVGIKNSEKKESAKPSNSQSVTDYVHLIPKVEEVLASNEKAKNLFAGLTPGYQKEWARYVYSAKQEATQAKRKVEMITILENGFKTKALYQESKRENGEN